MFNGEFESLKAIHGTCTVKVPKPIKVCTTSSRYFLEFFAFHVSLEF